MDSGVHRLILRKKDIESRSLSTKLVHFTAKERNWGKFTFLQIDCSEFMI